jgi:hypothetical protein
MENGEWRIADEIALRFPRAKRFTKQRMKSRRGFPGMCFTKQRIGLKGLGI